MYHGSFFLYGNTFLVFFFCFDGTPQPSLTQICRKMSILVPQYKDKIFSYTLGHEFVRRAALECSSKSFFGGGARYMRSSSTSHPQKEKMMHPRPHYSSMRPIPTVTHMRGGGTLCKANTIFLHLKGCLVLFYHGKPTSRARPGVSV